MGGPVLVIVVCPPAGVALVAWLAHTGRLATVPIRRAAVPAEAARRKASWRWAGVISGLVAGSAAAGSGPLGRGLLLAAPVFGLCVLAGVVVGETGVRPPGGPARRAPLEVRRVRDHLPRGLAQAVIAAGAALRVVTRRPRTGAYLGAVAADDALRQRAAQAITGACGILVALPLAGARLLTAGALLSFSCRPAWWTSAGSALLALLPATAALIGWCAAVLLAPVRAGAGALPA